MPVTRRLAIALVLASAALAGAAAALAGTAAHRRVATTDATKVLQSLKLPPGAQSMSGDPSSGHLLGKPELAPATPALVDEHAFWTVSGSPRQVLTWIEGHAPADSVRDESGASANQHGTTTMSDGYAFAAVPGVESLRQLVVTVAHASGGGTALRADAQVVWIVTRPGAERIPKGVTKVLIKRLEKRPVTVATITSPPLVRRVVKLVNRLPVAQPGTSACPMISGPPVVIDMLHGTNPKPIAALLAYDSDCVGIEFTLRGRAGPPLGHGSELIAALASLTGIKLR